MFYVDAHEDIAYGALALGRNISRTVAETRRREAGSKAHELSGTGTLGFQEMRDAGVGLVFATLFTLPLEEQKKGEMAYPCVDAAHEQARAQLELYKRWAAEDEYLHIVRSRSDLRRLEALREDPSRRNMDLGLLILMENAAPITTPSEAAWWWEHGVRIIGPAWANNRYTGCSRDGGGLTDAGRDLLREMDTIGYILDLTHSSDAASEEALERYNGAVVVTHANARRIAKGTRMIRDDILEAIATRGGMLGLMPANWALGRPEATGDRRGEVRLSHVIDTILTLREWLGDLAVGLGSDWDGGFGREQLPLEFDSIADIGLIETALLEAGAAPSFASGFMGGNWLRLLHANLPD
ncbi:MAG: dipeptidase [Spirochaetota bacterium]